MPYAGPTEIHIRGEDWVRDGSWFVKKSLLDQYGGDVENVPPQLVEQNRVSYPDGVSTQVTEQRAQAQGDPSGQDQYFGMKRDLGQAEFDRRWQLANSIGVNRSTDTGPKGALADELFYGHIDELPGMPGVFFNARSNGTFTFKDANGNDLPPNAQLMQAAQAGLQQGYGTGEARLNPDGSPRVPGGQAAGGQPPTLPQAPGANNAPVKPKGPIFSNPQGPTKQAPVGAPEQPVLQPAQPKVNLQAGVAQLPTAPMTDAGGGTPQQAPGVSGDTSIFKMGGTGGTKAPAPAPMPDFMKSVQGGTPGALSASSSMPQLPKAPGIGKAAPAFKIG